MTSETITVSCGCSSCAAAIFGNIWVSMILASLLVIAISLDFYHIWRRCKERETRLNKLLNRKKGACHAGDCR